MLPLGDVGTGEIMLALVPTLNLLVLAVIYKLTGRTREQLVGQASQINKTVEQSKEAIQTDLRNGIRDRLDRVEGKVDHLVREERKQ